MKSKCYFYLICCLCMASCAQQLDSIGDQSITVFDQVNLYFDMAFKENPRQLPDSIWRLDAGRVILKKLTLPNYAKQAKVELKLSLTSNGDPWDKSGSLFVIPKTADLNLLDFETGKFNLKTLSEKYPAVVPLQHDQQRYQPNVELLRFMTPFGVGHFSEDERVKARKPPYIPFWEKEVVWSQDITHLLPLLEEEVYLGVYIDTWTKEGYRLSLELNFTESEIPHHQKKQQVVLPLVNTVKYAAEQKAYDAFARQPVAMRFTTDRAYQNAKLYYLTTGHGGHSEGDEFVKKENQVYFDGQAVKTFTPWRDDCASFRRFNPTSGTWLAKAFMPDEKSDDKIASSDLSRSNWCPGSAVLPEVIELGTLSAGEHELKIAIPEAQEAKENEHNYWMVSAYLVYEL